ncbi:hypothetical protein SK128_019634, partial [Halocaridina rubra]
MSALIRLPAKTICLLNLRMTRAGIWGGDLLQLFIPKRLRGGIKVFWRMENVRSLARPPPYRRNSSHCIYKLKTVIVVLQVDNVEEVLVLHTDFIYSVMKGCLLTSPELLRILSKLISICVSFASFIEESPEPAPNSHEDSQSFEQTISKLELEFSGMMYTFMEKIKELSCENPNDPFFSVLY